MARVLSAVLVGTFMLFAGQANAQGASATIVCDKGQAEVMQGGRGGWKKVASGTSVSAGDRVRVPVGSSCKINYANGGTTALAAGQTVAITTVPTAAAGGGAAAAGAGAGAAGGLGGLAGGAFLPIVGGAVLAGGLAAAVVANDDDASPR